MTYKAIFPKHYLVMFDQAVYSGISFLATILLARLMNITAYGVLASIVIVGFLLLNISNALVIQPMQIGVAKFSRAKSYNSFTLLIEIGLAVICICTGITFDLLNLSGQIVPQSLQSSVGPNFGLLIGLMLSGWIIHDYLRKLFLANDKPEYATLIDSSFAAVFLLQLGLAYFKGESSLNGTLTMYIFNYTLSVVVGIVLLNPKLNFKRSTSPLEYFSYHKKEGSILLLSSFVQWWSSNIFVIASGVLLSVEILAAFRLVQSIFGILNMALQTVENYVIPKVSRLHLESTEKASAFLNRLYKKAGLGFLICSIPLFIYSEEIMSIIGGAQFVQYHHLIKGMVVLYAFICLTYSARIPIRVLELSRDYFLGYLISFVFSLFYINPLLSTYSAKGAIAGLIINQLVLFLFWKYRLHINIKSYENSTSRSW